MRETFRLSMAWLHSWAGVIVGSLLFTIFWMGSLSVFDREFDRWMQPETRLAAKADAPISLDRIIAPLATTLASDSQRWAVTLPSERTAFARFTYTSANDKTVAVLVDPVSGQILKGSATLGGSRFFLPFHHRLLLKWRDVGIWLVGLAAMTMLALLVSGLVIHRKLLADFFLFRPRKRLQQATLDLHRLSGVLVLPFHFLITLSGLILFVQLYFPFAHVHAYGEGKKAAAAFRAETNGSYSRPKLDAPGVLASLDAMIIKAERHWQGSKAAFVRVWYPGDAASFVEIRRSPATAVTSPLDTLYFDAASGELLYRFEPTPVLKLQRFFAGMHTIQFDHWGLRWLYWLAGICGCVLIGSGHLFWLRSRHARQGLNSVRWMEVLVIGGITGLIASTAAYLLANRLLPQAAALGAFDRADLEVWAFYLAWIASFLHAAWRRSSSDSTQAAYRAWQEQCWAIAGLALSAVALNALTTGDHLGITLLRGDWQVAGVDLMLLLSAVVAASVARRLQRVRRSRTGSAAHA